VHPCTRILVISLISASFSNEQGADDWEMLVADFSRQNEEQKFLSKSREIIW